MNPIKCPHCGYADDPCELPGEVVTYWGESDPVDVDCASCGKTYWVEETVIRTWTVTTEEPE